MFLKGLKNIRSRGQTIVEYIVLMAVVVGVIISVMKRVKDYLLADTENCTPQSTQIICVWQATFDETNNFRYFQIRR